MKGILKTSTLNAKALEGNPLGDSTRRMLVSYLPPGYSTSQRQYPVIYFLHGFTGSAATWLNFSGFSPTVPDRLDRLIAQGEIPEVIGIFVDGWTSLGGSQWINSEAIGRYQDYLVDDVVPYVDRSFRTVPDRRSRAMIGKSSGGYGVLALARHHPEVFAHAACHSADAYFEYCYLPEIPIAASALLKSGGLAAWHQGFRERTSAAKMASDDHATLNTVAMAAAYSPSKGQPLGIDLPFEVETGRLKTQVWERWLEHDPVRFIPSSSDRFSRLESVFIDCGTRDEFNLRWGTRLIAQQLSALKIDVVHEEFDGGHRGTEHRYDRSLRHLAPRLWQGEGAACAVGLASKDCVPCRGGVPALKGAALKTLLDQLTGWKVVGEHHLERTFGFPDFAQGLELVNQIGALAEEQGHHPDLQLAWGKVTVSLWTHKIDGLTESDFVLAAKIDELPGARHG